MSNAVVAVMFRAETLESVIAMRANECAADFYHRAAERAKSLFCDGLYIARAMYDERDLAWSSYVVGSWHSRKESDVPTHARQAVSEFRAGRMPR